MKFTRNIERMLIQNCGLQFFTLMLLAGMFCVYLSIYLCVCWTLHNLLSQCHIFVTLNSMFNILNTWIWYTSILLFLMDSSLWLIRWQKMMEINVIGKMLMIFLRVDSFRSLSIHLQSIRTVLKWKNLWEISRN